MPWTSRRAKRNAIIALSLVVTASLISRCIISRNAELPSTGLHSPERSSSIDTSVEVKAPKVIAGVKDSATTTPVPLATPSIPGVRGDDVRFLNWLRDAKDRITSEFVIRYLQSNDSPERKTAVLETYLESNPKSFYPHNRWRETILTLFREGAVDGGLVSRCADVLRESVRENPSEALHLERALREQQWPDRQQGALLYAINNEHILIEYGSESLPHSATRGYVREGLERLKSYDGLWKLAESDDSASRPQTILSLGRKLISPAQAQEIIKRIESIYPDKKEELTKELLYGVAQSNAQGATSILISAFEKYLERCKGSDDDSVVPGEINPFLIATSYWGERSFGHNMKEIEEKLISIAIHISEATDKYPNIDKFDSAISSLLFKLSSKERLSPCVIALNDKCDNDPFRTAVFALYEPYAQKQKSRR